MEVNTSEIGEKYKLVRKIGIALLVGVLIMAGLVEMIKFNHIHRPEPFEGFNYLRYGLLTYAVLEFFIIRKIRQSLFKFNEIPSVKTQAINYKKFIVKSVHILATCHVVCIYGMVLFILGGTSVDFYLFFALSLIYLWVYFPRYAQMEEWVSNQLQGIAK